MQCQQCAAFFHPLQNKIDEQAASDKIFVHIDLRHISHKQRPLG
jgi:hypothetical protein